MIASTLRTYYTVPATGVMTDMEADLLSVLEKHGFILNPVDLEVAETKPHGIRGLRFDMIDDSISQKTPHDNKRSKSERKTNGTPV